MWYSLFAGARGLVVKIENMAAAARLARPNKNSVAQINRQQERDRLFLSLKPASEDQDEAMGEPNLR